VSKGIQLGGDGERPEFVWKYSPFHACISSVSGVCRSGVGLVPEPVGGNLGLRWRCRSHPCQTAGGNGGLGGRDRGWQQMKRDIFFYISVFKTCFPQYFLPAS